MSIITLPEYKVTIHCHHVNLHLSITSSFIHSLLLVSLILSLAPHFWPEFTFIS